MRNLFLLSLSFLVGISILSAQAEGALADILLINGNPLEDISILTNPEENLDLIMKDGVIYKNNLDNQD